MKRRSRILAVCALMALLLAVCVPVLSAASADGEETIMIKISGTTTCYGDNGKQAGVLNTDGDVQLTYRAVKSKEDVPVILLYTYTTEDSGLGADQLEGKVRVTLQRVPTEMVVSVDSPDATTSTPATDVSANTEENAETTPEMAVTPQPEPLGDVWIDASVIIPALNETLILKDADIKGKDEKITTLEANESAEEPVVLPIPSDAIVDDNPDTTDTADTGLFQSLLFPIVACVALLVIAGGAIWSAVSLARTARETGKTNDEKNSKNQSLKSMEQSLARLSERTDPAVAIKDAMMDPTAKTPYMKSIAADTAEARTILARMEEKADFAPQPAEQLTHPDTAKKRAVIALTNSLAGKASREDWANIILESGYRYVLVQTSATDREALQEDRTGNSVLACLMKGAEAEEAYLVPSFEDPNAGENLWKNFYAVTDDAAVQHYRIDEPAVMKVVNNGAFFTLDTKGKLSRRL